MMYLNKEYYNTECSLAEGSSLIRMLTIMKEYEAKDLMFSTFKFDCTGREIYEGDILGTRNSDPEYDLWEFEENGFTTVLFDGTRFSYSNWWLDDDGDSIFNSNFLYIMGNIYQGTGDYDMRGNRIIKATPPIVPI